jgi:hypothetical protein
LNPYSTSTSSAYRTFFNTFDMRFATASTFSLAALALAPSALAGSYKLTDNYSGTDFLQGFSHQNIVDPTQGRV